MKNNANFLATLHALISDQKFLLALITVVSIIIVQLVPSLAPHADELTNVLIVLGGILVLHQGIEDVAGLRGQLPSGLQQALIDIVAEVMGKVNTPQGPVTPASTSAQAAKAG